MSTTENTATAKPPPEDEDDDASPSMSRSATPLEEGAQEEDELFTNIEKEEEAEAAAHVAAQPKDVKAAPRLLQKALETGDVQASDSEQESDQEKKPQGEDHHVHQRVSFGSVEFWGVGLCDGDAWFCGNLCLSAAAVTGSYDSTSDL